MDKFYGEICQFLQNCDLYIYKVREGYGYISAKTEVYGSHRAVPIILIGITANSLKDAEIQSGETGREIKRLTEDFGIYPLIISEDRWRRQRVMTGSRLLAHLEIFTQIYARNCEIRRIDKVTANAFLEEHHSYGDAACKYRYGLFLKRHTGHNALLQSDSPIPQSKTFAQDYISPGTLVAVATFSNARKWIKGDKTIRSYEWTRYASLPGIRLSGGMGRLLKAFIKDVQPDDIMTYADLEWSEGKVYEQLGFTLEGTRPSVTFTIDTSEWSRTAMSSEATAGVDMPTPVSKIFQNFGSNKYRLKLTDYQ